MGRFIASRLAYTVAVMWAAATVVFLALRITPGDPANFVVDPTQSAAVKARIDAQLGLNHPLLTQYGTFLHKVLTFEFGHSFINHESINQTIATAAPNTLLLAGSAGLIMLGFGIPLGVIAAVRRGGIFDRVIGVLGPLAMGIPSFVLAVLLVKIFTLQLKWLPAAGTGGIRYLIMPAVVLAVEPLVVTIRLMRASVIEQLSLDYVRTLRAKGMAEWRVIWQHVLRNSLGPIMSLTAVQFRSLIGYTLIVEVIFRWPGLGEALVNAVLTRDYPTAQALALILTLAVILASFVADIGLAFTDPRLRRREAA